MAQRRLGAIRPAIPCRGRLQRPAHAWGVAPPTAAPATVRPYRRVAQGARLAAVPRGLPLCCCPWVPCRARVFASPTSGLTPSVCIPLAQFQGSSSPYPAPPALHPWPPAAAAPPWGHPPPHHLTSTTRPPTHCPPPAGPSSTALSRVTCCRPPSAAPTTRAWRRRAPPSVRWPP